MVRDPIFTLTPLAEPRPTQITVGMREVKAKLRHWRSKLAAQAGLNRQGRQRGEVK